MKLNAQKPSMINDDWDNEGLSVLTSEERADLRKYLSRVPRSYHQYSFDGKLYDVLKEVFEDDERVLASMSDSIHDEHCTKQFYDVPLTFDQVEGFLEDSPENKLWNTSVRAACAVVSKSMQVKSLKPYILTKVEDLDALWTNPKASAGAIKLGSSKKDSKEECFSAAMKIKQGIADGQSFEELQIPAVPFHRAQISGFITDEGYNPDALKEKNRLVWGVDGGTVTIEAQYAKPLIDYLSPEWLIYAGGKSPEMLRSRMKNLREDTQEWMSVDFSKFDQTIPDWLIRWCFNIIKKYFPKECESEIDFICYNFINTQIAIPGRGIVKKRRGIPSGSNFTQIVGSMCNAVIVLSYVASQSDDSSFEGKISYINDLLRGSREGLPMFVMGDDDIIFSNIKFDTTDLSRYVKLNFGVKINPDKCDAGSRFQFPSFLKREWRINGEWQDPCYLTVNVIHPERERQYNGYTPWHILYGLYLTYRLAFPRNLSEYSLVVKMEENGGVSALRSIPRSDLPGVMRAFGNDALERMVARAEYLVNKGPLLA